MYRATTTLQQRFWNSKLLSESMTADIFQMFEGLYSDKKKTMPDGIKIKVDLKGKRSAVMTLLKNLSGSGVVGRSGLIGNEVDQDTRELIVYANELRHAVNTERYGIDANEKEPYKLLEAVQPQLSLWWKEMMGKYIRQAIVEKYSENLEVAPHSLTLGLNENILVKNVNMIQTGNNQANYQGSASNAAYIEDVGDALNAAGTTSAAYWDVQFLNRIQYWANVQAKIKPLAGGKYIVLVPSRQAAFLKDPQNTEGLAGLYINSQMKELAQKFNFDQYLGDFGQLSLFEDPRAPIFDLTGSDGSWAIAPKYKGAGDDDERTSTSGTVFDVGMILGEGAVVEASYEPQHFVEEIQDYEMIRGVGIAGGIGYNRTVFYNDATSETRASTINQGSGLLINYAGTLTA